LDARISIARARGTPPRRFGLARRGEGTELDAMEPATRLYEAA